MYGNRVTIQLAFTVDAIWLQYPGKYRRADSKPKNWLP